MAFASVGSMGSMSEKATNDTAVLSLSSGAAVGNLVGVWVAWQSHYFFGPDGRQNVHHGCIDSVGNIYTTLVSWYIFDAYVGLFLAEVTSELTTSDTITVTWQGTGSGVGQTKAVSAWEFSKNPNKRWAYVYDRTAGAGVTNGDPPAVTISSLPAGTEYLLLHVLGSEGPNTDTFTWDSDYTQIDGNGTTGGADNSNVTLRGGFRIATLTTDTVDVTNTTATRDVDNALMAIMELDEEPFPTSQVVDDFNRANENPLDNGTWDTGTPPGFGSGLLQIISNVVTKDAGGGEGSQWWLEEFDQFQAECAEIYATLSVRGEAGLYFLGTGGGGTANLDCGIVAFTKNSGATSAGPYMSYGRAANGGSWSAGESIRVWYDMQSGEKFGGQWISPIFHLWADRGSGWEWISATYETAGLLDVFTGFRRMGMTVIADTTTRLDDFGLGAPTCFIPQIYRRVSSG